MLNPYFIMEENMKKALSIVLSAMLLLTLASVVFADSNLDIETPWVDIEDLAPDALAPMFGDTYPYSVDYDWPECKSDPVITGTVIVGVGPDGTTHCWSNGTDNGSCAFDGDTISFYDPFEASTKSWVGLRLDQAYELTEVRICNRSGQEARIIGAAIQGSNDNGATWHNVVYFDKEIYGTVALLTNDYHIVTPEPNDEYIQVYKDNCGLSDEEADFSHFWVGHGSYNMYRYVNLVGTHGDCAEIELYGHPADAYVGESKEIEEYKASTIDEYFDAIDYVGSANVTVDGSVSGKVIGGGGSYSAGSNEYADAWDDNGDTFYDPAGANPGCWTGILADQATVVTEVRVRPRSGWFSRTAGAHIQGSNDGINWTTLAEYTADDVLADDAEQTYIVKTVEGADAFWMFRYVNDGTNHGDVGDVVIIGTPGEATLAWEVPAAPAAPAVSSTGTGYDEAAAAAAAIGSKPIMTYEYVDGSTTYFGDENPGNLWDDDVTTKFCTDGFPAWSVASVDGKYKINGIIMATANDNSSYNGRSPNKWTLYGSLDNAGWDPIASGDETFFEETDYTFYVTSIPETAEYSYFKFECEETVSGTMQVSEVVLCSADAPEVKVEEPAPVEEVVEDVTEAVTDVAENVADAAGDAVEAVENTVTDAADAVSNAVTDTANNVVETAKSGCGSFIGGGLIVLVTVLGSAWISRRK